MTGKGMTVAPEIIPKTDICVIPERTAQGNIRVSKPGDADYVPQCETTRAFVEGRPKTFQENVMDILEGKADKPKRGLDIKCFEDLPPDVQETINHMSQRAGKIDPLEKVKRTAIAVNYQRSFPGRYYPVSTYHYPQDAAVTGKPEEGISDKVSVNWEGITPQPLVMTNLDP